MAKDGAETHGPVCNPAVQPSSGQGLLFWPLGPCTLGGGEGGLGRPPPENSALPPQGALRVSHEGHVFNRPTIQCNYRIPALFRICPDSVPQQPSSYPKVTFLRFRRELESYLEACALYTAAFLLGPWFLFSLARCVPRDQASKTSRESRPRILWRKVAFMRPERLPLTL